VLAHELHLALQETARALPVGPVHPEDLLRRGRTLRRRRQRLRGSAAGLALSVLAVTGYAATTDSTLLGWRPTNAQVAAPLPPVDASPEDVVRAYVAALNAVDTDAVRALSTPEKFQRDERAEGSWLRKSPRITKLQLGPTRPESGEGTSAAGLRFVVFITAEFDLGRHDAATESGGPTVWGYLLGRNSTAERWLVVDEGV